MATPTSPGPVTGAPARTSGKGTAALVCGILSLPTGAFLAPVGLILGVVAIVLGAMARSENRAMGVVDGKATGGLVTGILGSLIAISVIVFFGWVFAQFGDDIEACSNQPTDAAVEACMDERMSQDR